MAKLIVRGSDREKALQRMRQALEEYIIEGIKTNLLFHKRVMGHPDFLQGKVTTAFLEKYREAHPATR